MRIDSHHHVWDLSVREQGWMVGEALNPIKKNFSINDLTSHYWVWNRKDCSCTNSYKL